MKTQSSTKEWELTKSSIHLETGGMTSKRLGHSYSHKNIGTFESLLTRSLNVAKRRKFLGNSFEKTQTGSQFVISKLGSGLRLRFQN